MKARYFVALFIVACLVAFCQEGKAEVTAELGAGFLSSQYSKGAVGILSERWGGPYGSRYAVGMGIISDQEVLDRSRDFYNVKTNLFVFAQRRISFNLQGCTWDCISLGLGVSYFNRLTRWNGRNFNAALSLEMRPTDRWSVNIRHFSNGGSGEPNMGQDAITIGYTF